MEGRIAGRPIRQPGRVCSHHPSDHEDARDHEDDDDDHLDRGQPELRLAVDACRQSVETDDDDEEHDRPDPRGNLREPVGHDEPGGNQVGRDRDRPVEPVVPPHRKPEGRGDELRGKGLERARDRLVSAHLPQRLHEEKHHEADGGVGDERTARSRVGDGRTGGQEETCSDCSADRNHLHVARCQASLELGIRALAQLAGDVVGGWGCHDWVPRLSVVSPILMPEALCRR